MSTQAFTTTDRSLHLERLVRTVDSVYFLTSGGWDKELESNRTHYARRWAQRLPVTLVQPSQRFARLAGADPTPAIDNCEILPIAKVDFSAPLHLRGAVQAAQVLEHMRKRQHTSPLLWCYNPGLASLYAALPAVARVYHASENHFDFEGMPELFYRELEATLRISDLVIPVSSGVADGIRARVPEAHQEIVTNGCDVRQYRASGPSSPEIAAAREDFARVAVFAGNVNNRIDFELVEKAAAANPSTVLVFVGPTASLDGADAESWQRIRRATNVRHLGSMTPAEVAAVYRSADVGFIPYRRDPWIVRNGFPLKTLEMAATGLPVVSTEMRPITGLASAIAVADDDELFLEWFSAVSRSTTTDEQRLELLDLATANDYNRKFDEVVAHIAGAIPEGRAAHTRLDELVAGLGDESWRESCSRTFELAKPSILWRGALLAYDGFAKVVPAGTRHRLVPSALRRWARSRVAE